MNVDWLSTLNSAKPRLWLAALLLGVVPCVRAQDRRKVTEPVLPPVCVRLTARLPMQEAVGHGWTLAPADESRPDTARIQQALNRCLAGHAVELASDGAMRAFLSGPLQLRRGVTLQIAAGAVLFASRDPRLYDITPGSCGVVNRDGRGWAPLLHESVSWWDLAHQAKIQSADQNCPRLLVLNPGGSPAGSELHDTARFTYDGPRARIRGNGILRATWVELGRSGRT